MVGASAQVLAAHDAAVADVPLQFPSVPINEEHVDVVPVYEEHSPRLFVQPYPVVTQPAKKSAHAALVDVETGASAHARALQAVEPVVVFTEHGPSVLMRPVHP